jgi:NADPH-dependent 2,4-dienoyl-CoA reductase/sulfur reductase-like enzyme
VHNELITHGVEVITGTQVSAITRAPSGDLLLVQATGPGGETFTRGTDLVLVVVGVRPETKLAANAGAQLGTKGAIEVDQYMRTSLPDVFAAGDCVVTHHRLLGKTWLPLGTTAHKQGRVAGENALGGRRWFAGSLGTQVARSSTWSPPAPGCVTTKQQPPTAAGGRPPRPAARTTTRRTTQAPTRSRSASRATPAAACCWAPSSWGGAEISKRVDTYATALFHGMAVDDVSELDLSYTPPLGSPWDAVQVASQAWMNEHHLDVQRRMLGTA